MMQSQEQTVVENGNAQDHLTATLSLIMANLAGPMPFTSSRSSTSWNRPTLSRKAIIRSARAGPIPGRASRSKYPQLLRSIRSDESDREIATSRELSLTDSLVSETSL